MCCCRYSTPIFAVKVCLSVCLHLYCVVGAGGCLEGRVWCLFLCDDGGALIAVAIEVVVGYLLATNCCFEDACLFARQSYIHHRQQ